MTAGIFFGACCIGGFFGFKLFAAPAILPVLSGVALAGLVLLGIEFWPIIFISVYATYLFLGMPFIYGAAFAGAYTCQTVLATYLLERNGFNYKLARLRDGVVFLVTIYVSAVIVPLTGLLLAAFIPIFSGSADALPFWFSFGYWWTGGIFSMLILTPLILRFSLWPHVRTRLDLLEIAGAVGSLVGITIASTFYDVSDIAGISIVYILLVPLFWIALRLGPRVMTLALFLLSVIAVGEVLYDAPAFDAELLSAQLFGVELLIVIIATIFLILVTAEEERKETNKELTFHVGELEHALSRLHDQEQAKNDFLATLAHELRNPLGAIMNYFELMREKGDIKESGAEAASIIDKRLTSINHLLTDLLDISRISENKIVLTRARIDLRDAIRAAVENVSHVARNRHQALAVSLPEHELFVLADLVRLEQVFTNLLTNASKFAGRRGSIKIAAASEDNLAIVTVEDNGSGIDPADLKRIFQHYYQADENAGGRHAGLGIGLALAHNLVRLHEGTIKAESAGKGAGSRFTVSLPLTATAVPAGEPARFESPPADVAARPRRVLVVDDNRAAARGVQRLLEASGYEVECAYGGREALMRAAVSAPHAIFLDLNLPDLSGYEVAAALRNDLGFKGVIAALSGSGQTEDIARAHDAGCSHHLTKPVRLAELLAVLEMKGT